MTKNDNAVLVEGLTKPSEGATSLLTFQKRKATVQEDGKPFVSAEEPAKVVSLSLDLETRSSVDIEKSGVYRYAESDDFAILLFGVSVNLNL